MVKRFCFNFFGCPYESCVYHHHPPSTHPNHSAIKSHCLRLAISAIVRSKFGALICLMGICCSSWVTINAGTSLRSWMNPMGCLEVVSVQVANKMVARLVVWSTNRTKPFVVALKLYLQGGFV